MLFDGCLSVQVSDLDGRSRAYSELVAPVLGPFSAALEGGGLHERYLFRAFFMAVIFFRALAVRPLVM